MIRRLALPTIAFAAAFALAGCDGEDDKKQAAGNENQAGVEEVAKVQKKTHVKPDYLFTFDFNLASEKHNGTYEGTVRAYCKRHDDLRLAEYTEKCRDWIMEGLEIKDRIYDSQLHVHVATDNPDIRPHALVGGDDWIKRAVGPMDSWPIAVVKELKFTPNN